MVKWPRFGYCKTRLSKDIGKENALKIQNNMLRHTITVANFLSSKNIIDISLAINGIGSRSSFRWCENLGIRNFNFQGRGCLGEKMKRQVLLNYKNFKREKYSHLIIVGTDLPDLCHLDFMLAISKLEESDVVLGPSNDGGYWLIGLSNKFILKNTMLPFINIRWSEEDVLIKTIENLSLVNTKIDFLKSKVDIDTISDIAERK
tara:strand:- start:5924 stop:6535 length:612 start_codon:yes stop_codon:yes gene_type:complete